MVGNLAGKVALIVEYDGAAYAGWQRQTNALSVQEQLERACTALFGTKVGVRGASRTDAGVHARGQVASLSLPRPFPSQKLVPALNWNLPRDIRLAAAYKVPENFNPIAWSKGKIYRYYIYLRRRPTPIGVKYYWHVPKPLNIEAINKEAQLALGCRDFASFQGAGSQVKDTTRTLRRLCCWRKGDWLIFNCVGNGFLYNMVRILVGTLVEFGLGKRAQGDLAAILEACDRRAAGVTAPAKGLVLERVLYRPSLDSYPQL